MSEHGFLAAMLAVVGLEVVVLGLAAVYYGYRLWKAAERMEAIGAATFLEVRKVLGR
ncbi:MAG: hypothetical protein HYU25_00950 [Candidatus Rokubacteria bacterium]|nr:hypothetical protein [Candidatus Rokubacteria bacterium]